MASKREIKEYRVDQKERTVTVYVQSLSEKQQNEIEFYVKMGYKVIALDKEKPKPRAKTSIDKDDMKKYLKGKISNDIYNKMLTHLKEDKNFFQTKSWLKEELTKEAKRKNQKYVSFNTIIAVEKENEKIISKANAEEYKIKNQIKEDTDTEENADNE